MKLNSIIIFLFIAANAIILNSQTIPCDLTFKDGKLMRNTRLIGLHEDLLLVSDSSAYKIMNVDKVSKLRFDKGTYMWTGMAVGATTGFVAGIVLYEAFSLRKKKLITNDAALGVTLFFALPAAIIGSIIGVFFRNIDFYDLSDMRPYMKSKEIKAIMKDHREWK